MTPAPRKGLAQNQKPTLGNMSPSNQTDQFTYSRSVKAQCPGSNVVNNGLVVIKSPLDYLYWQDGLHDHPDVDFTNTLLSYIQTLRT